MPKGVFVRTNKHKLAIREGLSKSLKIFGRIPWNKGTKGIMKSWNKGKHTGNYGNGFKKGMTPWNKGIPMTNITKQNVSNSRKGKLLREKNPLWKGNEATYISIHCWVRYHKGRPQVCVHCGVTKDEKRLEWSNINHKYQRNLADYVSVCRFCHRDYDYKHNLKNNNRIGTNQFKEHTYKN